MAAIDLDALLASLFKPARPQLAAAREAVVGLDDPVATWRALCARGLAVDDPRRAFAAPCAPCDAACRSFCADPALGPIRDELLRARARLYDTIEPNDRRVQTLLGRLLWRTLQDAYHWRVAVANDLRVDDCDWTPPAMVGRRFVELSDPFEPLLELCRMGFLLRQTFDGQIALLVVPPFDGSHAATATVWR